MAYVNVAEWKPDQVTEWLKGLDVAILPYVHSFLNNRVSGQQLLGFGPNDLEHLGIRRIGHQEIILEGIEHLRNIHYELDRENLQLLAMRLSCQTHSLHNELCHSHVNSQRLSTQILADIANIVSCVKPLIAWLDRPGFSGQAEYTQTRSEVLRLALAMATCGQRDRFAEAPVTEMKDASARLAKLSDAIVQEMTDPLILQPASLDLATVKKRSSDDLGFYIVPSLRGAHQISDLKLNSPAHQCGKIEPGDEIIQINYQTVVGWGVKEVMHLFAESPTEILLTLKKRPKHTKVYGQIYVKPYRLPSKKRAIHSHAFTPRPDLLTRLQFRLPVPLHTFKLPTVGKVENPREHRDSSSSEEEVVTVQHKLVVPSKPVHRRATITGASPLSKRPPLDIHELWHNLKLEKDSCPKQSTSSVVDFEERVSSGNKNGASSLTHSGDHESSLETLSIKQKIQMFSRDHNNKQEKQKIAPKKQQLRINSEPIFDGRNISEAVIMFMKKPSDLSETNKSINENVEPTSSKQPTIKEPVSLPINLESLPCSEPCASNVPQSRHLPEPPKEIALPSKYYDNEEHGKVVETINRHILADTFGDEVEARDYRSYGKNLDSGKDVDKLGGLPVLGKKRYQSNLLSSECDSELSRTISKVNTEDIINNKEQLSPSSLPYGLSHKNNFQVLPRRVELPVKITPKNTNLDKSFSNDSINRLPDTRVQQHVKNESWSSSGVSDYDSSTAGSSLYNSLQDRHLRGGGATSKDCYDNVSAKSFPSSDLTDRTPRTEPALERQTLPKAGVKLSQQPPSLVLGGAGAPVPPPRPSLSKPPNACYRAIMAARSLGKASPKTQRKKNTLIAKRREVSIKDFPIVECEGWLLQRCRKGSGTWIKRWCLIHANTLYAFKTKQPSDKAETMVCLPGFTVSPAEEVKSKQFAFKVYHTGTMFYFAAETNFELTVWLDAISTATLGPNTNSQNVVYSESEDEEKSEACNTYGTSKKPAAPPAPTPSPRSPVSPPSSQGEGSLFGSLKKLGSRSSSNNTPSNASAGSSLDRKCLRILGSGPVPVPTAQYRSYRRVHNTAPAPPPNNPTSTPTSSKDRDHSEHHSPLPPEMADYRLASLTAKTTPPVPRRRVVPVVGPTPPSSSESRRPHISAPILNHPSFQGMDDRTRRPLNSRESLNEYRNAISSETSWIDSLKRGDVKKKKIKSKKGFSTVTRTHHVHPSHHSEPQPSHAMGTSSSTSALPPPDYPGLEYPPIFEPGTYTLDALSLLPRNANTRNQ